MDFFNNRSIWCHFGPFLGVLSTKDTKGHKGWIFSIIVPFGSILARFWGFYPRRTQRVTKSGVFSIIVPFGSILARFWFCPRDRRTPGPAPGMERGVDGNMFLMVEMGYAGWQGDDDSGEAALLEWRGLRFQQSAVRLTGTVQQEYSRIVTGFDDSTLHRLILP